MLEETGMPYAVHVVDIERGDQHSPEFHALNPNGKIPVILDRATARTVFESGAILFRRASEPETLLAGLLPIQAGANAQLSKSVASPFAATTLQLLVGAVVLLLITTLAGSLAALAGLSNVPW
jgi:glutathione S-transferase